MYCLLLAMILFIIGLGIWVAGSIVEKKKKKSTRSRRKHYQQLADKLAMSARIVFILCAVAFIFGFILLIGSQTPPMQPL